MEGKLNQSEVESLLKAAQILRAASSKENGTVEPCHFERSAQFNSEQASVVNDIQESLAKGLSQSLGAYLRVSFETALVSVKQMTYRDAVDQLLQGTYLLSTRFHGAPAAIQIDRSLVFPLIDILLGGTGIGQSIDRDVTEIENDVMGGIGNIICSALAAAWSVDHKECELIGVQSWVQMQRLLPLNDRVVVSQFEVKVAETAGMAKIVVPSITSNSLLRRLSSDNPPGKSSKLSTSSGRLGERVLECSFPTTLGITAIRLSIERILALDSGQICDLGIPIHEPASLIIAGRDTFEALPVRQGRKRAAQIGQQRTSTEKRIGQ